VDRRDEVTVYVDRAGEHPGAVGRFALIMGGAGAIGGAIVDALRASGHEVAVLDRNGDFPCDLDDEQDVERTAEAVLERRGRCDVLVHVAAAFDQFTRVPRLRGCRAITGQTICADGGLVTR
jgi:predicted dinucleotide-binding enzyme